MCTWVHKLLSGSSTMVGLEADEHFINIGIVWITTSTHCCRSGPGGLQRFIRRWWQWWASSDNTSSLSLEVRASTGFVITITSLAILVEVLMIVLRICNIGLINLKIKVFLIFVSDLQWKSVVKKMGSNQLTIGHQHVVVVFWQGIVIGRTIYRGCNQGVAFRAMSMIYVIQWTHPWHIGTPSLSRGHTLLTRA